MDGIELDKQRSTITRIKSELTAEQEILSCSLIQMQTKVVEGKSKHKNKVI